VIRVVVGKVGLDGHDRGAKVIARGFRDAGMEVIYMGLRRSVDEIAQTVLQEDADVLGLSILSGAVVPLTKRVVAAMRERELDDCVILVGGIISPEMADELRRLGVDGAFGPGSSLAEIIRFTRARVAERRGEEVLPASSTPEPAAAPASGSERSPSAPPHVRTRATPER
jgi:methylmalonyl-CoA mutase, C-terminal domain